MLRLQSYLARCGVASRRGAEELILAGRVAVNGQIVTRLGSQVCPETDRIVCDGHDLRFEKKVIFLLYKPAGILTTLKDPQGRRTVAEYTREIPQRLFPVGRLDYDVTGLVILTNDGDYAEKLLHPRYGVLRTYVALVQGVPSPANLKKLLSGVNLGGEVACADTCSLLSESKFLPRALAGQGVVQLQVSEGKKHFVKKLLKEIGFPVRNLCRTAFGPYRLDGMTPGQLVEVRFR